MVDNQHKMISGYRDLSVEEIELINEVKQAELSVGELWRNIWEDTALPPIDRRWLSIARTHFEEGFSALVRAIAQPESRF